MKVGDYVRTKSYGIKKINDFSSTLKEDFIVCDYNRHQNILINKKDIIKTSSNIIDLIEVGDYVNGREVMEADWFNNNGEYEEGLAFPMYASDDLDVIENWLPLKNVPIKSIVTHEQFSQMEYKVGE